MTVIWNSCHKKWNAQECDATGDATSFAAGYNNYFPFLSTVEIVLSSGLTALLSADG